MQKLYHNQRDIIVPYGYVDDLDLGEEIIYINHGGNDPNSKRQISDQSWNATGNKALIVSELKGLSIRVTTGYKLKTAFSPKSGYELGGRYWIIEHFEEIGKDGYKICRFRLDKIESLKKQPKQKEITLPEGQEDTKRVKTSILRIVRDTELAKAIKELYDYTCQVCSTRILVRDVPYAEAAHMRPLGKLHNDQTLQAIYYTFVQNTMYCLIRVLLR